MSKVRHGKYTKNNLKVTRHKYTPCEVYIYNMSTLQGASYYIKAQLVQYLTKYECK